MAASVIYIESVADSGGPTQVGWIVADGVQAGDLIIAWTLIDKSTVSTITADGTAMRNLTTVDMGNSEYAIWQGEAAGTTGNVEVDWTAESFDFAYIAIAVVRDAFGPPRVLGVDANDDEDSATAAGGTVSSDGSLRLATAIAAMQLTVSGATKPTGGLTTSLSTLHTNPVGYGDFGVYGGSVGAGSVSSASVSGVSSGWELFTVGDVVVEGGPPAARVRSNVSEDAGSILDSASLNAVDASFSEAFLLDDSFPPTALKGFVEPLEPSVAAAAYYPIPRQSTEFLNDYSGETILSRMARVYPPPIFDEVAALGLATFPVYDQAGDTKGTAASAQNVIDYVFSVWASEYSWFAYETVPDLRLKVESPSGAGIATPSDYSADDELGRAYAEVIQFIQDEDNRKTMRQILDELLSPFPGTVVRANASGALEIVPIYGPDASNTAAVTLTDKDAYSETTGQPSPQGIINKWTFRSQPYTATVDGGLLNQSWFQVCSNGFPSGSLYASGTGLDISNDDPYIGGGATPNAWPPQSGRFPVTGTGIKLTDSSSVKQVTIDYTRSDGVTGSVSAGDITLTDIPTDGEWHQCIVADGSSISGLRVEIWGMYDASSRSVYLQPRGRNDYENGVFTVYRHAFRINLLDATDVWQAETTSVSGTYSESEETDNPLPGSPVSSSVAAYGEREKTSDITGWGIKDADQLQRMARAAVFGAIQPTLIRTVEQSVWRAYPVKFSDMGSVIALPSGDEGRLINRTYSDDFGTNFSQGSMSSLIKVEVTDPNGDGAIDTTTEYLLLDDGSAFVLDDDTQAEAG